VWTLKSIEFLKRLLPKIPHPSRSDHPTPMRLEILFAPMGKKKNSAFFFFCPQRGIFPLAMEDHPTEALTVGKAITDKIAYSNRKSAGIQGLNFRGKTHTKQENKER